MICPNEAMLQSYVDGELSAEATERTAAHVFACSLCAVAMSEIKSETLMLDAAFGQAFSAPPPTEKMRARLDAYISAQTAERIANIEPRTTRVNYFADWRQAFAAFFALPGTRRIAFACVAALMLIGSFLFFVGSRRTTPQIATNKTVVDSVAPAPDAASAPPETQSAQSVLANSKIKETSNARRGVEAIAPVAKLARARRTNIERVNDESLASNIAARRFHSTAPATEFLPGEQSYLKAIASLSAALEANGEKTSAPARVNYKRDLAIVDKAINATRREAVRHPRDTDATEFLLVAYQSKLDLLDTIASASR